MRRFATSMGCLPLPRMPSSAAFPLENPLENSPLKKGPLRKGPYPVLFFLGVCVSLVFSCCGNPWSFWVFSAYFPGFLRVRQLRKILGVFEVFLGIFEKTKEKKERVDGRKRAF